MTDTLQQALHGLTQALDAPRVEGTALGNWRWIVRQRMVAVRDALAAAHTCPSDDALVAREYSVLRERRALLSRMAVIGPRVLDAPDAEEIRAELRRLVADIGRHLQRLHDLVYDDVEMELGGSE